MAFLDARRGSVVETRRLRAALSETYGLVDAATASASLPRASGEVARGRVYFESFSVRRDSTTQVQEAQDLVLDAVENFDGLERLFVICVGLDEAIGDGAAQTRSRLYRVRNLCEDLLLFGGNIVRAQATTRAQLGLIVINERIEGGWLECLGHVELADEAFDAAGERKRRVENAADDVVARSGAVTPPRRAPQGDDSSSTRVEGIPRRHTHCGPGARGSRSCACRC